MNTKAARKTRPKTLTVKCIGCHANFQVPVIGENNFSWVVRGTCPKCGRERAGGVFK